MSIQNVSKKLAINASYKTKFKDVWKEATEVMTNADLIEEVAATPAFEPKVEEKKVESIFPEVAPVANDNIFDAPIVENNNAPVVNTPAPEVNIFDEPILDNQKINVEKKEEPVKQSIIPNVENIDNNMSIFDMPKNDNNVFDREVPNVSVKPEIKESPIKIESSNQLDTTNEEELLNDILLTATNLLVKVEALKEIRKVNTKEGLYGTAKNDTFAPVNNRVEENIFDVPVQGNSGFKL